ncbi:hypothetical protein INT48_000935, partial [Thamnidium elegans]
MSSNHRYEQIPLDNQTNVNTRPPQQQQQQQQRSDLEDTFDLNEEEEEVRTQTESHRLLPSSTDDSPYHIVSIPSSNDGVFSNMSAKPESDSTKPDEIPPVSTFFALEHAALNCKRKIAIKWIEATDLENDTLNTDPLKFHESWKAL